MKAKNKIITAILLSPVQQSEQHWLTNISRCLPFQEIFLLSRNRAAIVGDLAISTIQKPALVNPLLLVHDLTHASSSCELGFSDSTFKRALYCLHHRSFRLRTFREAKFNLHKFSLCAIVNDFVKSEIGRRTNILATRCVRSYRDNGRWIQSGSFRADDVYQSGFPAFRSHIPGKSARYYKFILDLPIIGTLLYNFASARSIISRTFSESYFYNPYDVNPHYIDKYHRVRPTLWLPEIRLRQCPV